MYRLLENHYERQFQKYLTNGASVLAAAEAITTLYLDGKPKGQGKKTITASERDRDFWSSPFLFDLAPALWRSDLMVLALTKYFAQDRVANPALLASIAAAVPGTVQTAVRHSGLVLRQHSPRRSELDQLAMGDHPEVAELCKVLDIIEAAYRTRVATVEFLKSRLAQQTPFDLLVLASLHVFEHLLPNALCSGRAVESEIAWGSINNILLWKLETTPADSLSLSERSIGLSLQAHLTPLLFPSPQANSDWQFVRAAFQALVEAQIELDSFISFSADCFSWDDSNTFVRHGQELRIEQVDPHPDNAWRRESKKLEQLHHYWQARALIEFSSSGLATKTFGRPENHEDNREAYIRAIRTRLLLTEVYGIARLVKTDAGEEVDVFQALLALELMSAFFRRDFIGAYAAQLDAGADWRVALQGIAVDGLAHDLANRFPVTWSERKDKIRNIKGWTVCAETPQGSERIAGRILDFWTSDWSKLAMRLRTSRTGMRPELFERPVLKLGHWLVQLPWLVGMQNNSTAAINNLRRLGARRDESRGEARRIEHHLAEMFEARGFRTALNWQPPKTPDDDAGEIDLICAKDGLVLVIEVKSTFIRQSQHEAWLHATTTLRKAGQQLQRKSAAVREALSQPGTLATTLGLADSEASPPIHGWIVDTSIDRDHHRFSGFLKLSLEELLVALRDDANLLAVDAECLKENRTPENQPASLYPDGFTAMRLLEIIESEAVWAGIR